MNTIMPATSPRMGSLAVLGSGENNPDQNIVYRVMLHLVSFPYGLLYVVGIYNLHKDKPPYFVAYLSTFPGAVS